MDKRGMKISLPIDIRPRLWFNPELRTAKFLVPGVFGLILLLSTVISTSLSVVREKELGTMEQLKTSPLHAYEIIIGKALPYVVIALLAATIILLMGWLLFDVTVKGSLLLLYFAILVFLLAGLGQGLLISAIANTQQIAFFMSVFSSLLPTFLLSGFVFPLKSMPWFLQFIGSILPTKYFLIIVRSIILKDVGFWPLWPEFLAMAIFTIATVTISSVRLHKDLSS
jgi:ABC-2 type transport system permease protein